MALQHGTYLRFGRFELQPAERRLLMDGNSVALAPRAFDLLLTLSARHGQMVTKDELFAAVWPRFVVEDNNLKVQIFALRKILGHDAIETISGHGYRFTPRVEYVESVTPTPETRPSGN